MIVRQTWRFWVAFSIGMGAYLTYLLTGGGHVDGRLVAAVLGDSWWVQGVAGWLWVAIIYWLFLLEERSELGPRRRRAALWIAVAMFGFALTIAPLGRGAGSVGEASAALGGGAEAPGFYLGLLIAVPTVPMAYRFATRKRRRQELDEAEQRRAGRDAQSYGLPRNGGWVLHPDWLRSTDPPAYARRIRERHSIAPEDLKPRELAVLEKLMRIAGR